MADTHLNVFYSRSLIKDSDYVIFVSFFALNSKLLLRAYFLSTKYTQFFLNIFMEIIYTIFTNYKRVYI